MAGCSVTNGVGVELHAWQSSTAESHPPPQVVSDMAARGLDIEDCDAVLNLELPSNASAYAHRAGRTGRLGRSALTAQP